MLLNSILAAEGSNNTWVMWVVIGVVLVLMIVLTIVPQKKRQKEQQKMMESLMVGTKLMTVGGLVGKITQVNSDNTLIINVGTEFNPTLIVIDRKAVGYVLEAVAAPAVESPVEAQETASALDEIPTVDEPVAEESAAETADIASIDEEVIIDTDDSSINTLNDPFGKA